MTNSIQSALDTLEQQIGRKAQDGFIFHFTDLKTRKRVISWLTIKGLVCDNHMSNETLGKLYGLPNYLQTALRNQKQGKRANFNFSATDPDEIQQPPNINNFPPTNNPQAVSINSNPIKSLVESIVKNSIHGEMEFIHEEMELESTKNKEFLQKQSEDIKNNIQIFFKTESENLKKLVEDTIFQSYKSFRLESQSNNPPEKIENEIELNKNQNTSFIPQIDPNYHLDFYATKVIRSALAMGENLYVYGDTGCGKTTHLEQVCAILNRGIVRVNPHDGITREMFLGGMKLINNETIFVEGALPIAMRNGYVFLVDEISFLPPNLTAILNPIGEKGGKLYIPETSEWITPKPGFCIFATDNTGGKGDRTGQYTGTEVQNTATLDRFAFCLKMDYLPIEKEKEMLERRFPNRNQTEIEKMLRLAKDIRAAFSRGELSITLSTRKLMYFFDQRENNFSTQEALSNTILSWLDEDDEALVKTMIDRLDLLKTNNQTINNGKIDLSKFLSLIGNNRKIEAIKELRIITNLGLREAKDLTESYMNKDISISELELKILSGISISF